jgi:hypothetical protein
MKKTISLVLLTFAVSCRTGPRHHVFPASTQEVVEMALADGATLHTGPWRFVHDDGRAESGFWQYLLIDGEWKDSVSGGGQDYASRTKGNGLLTVWFEGGAQEFLEVLYVDGQPNGKWELWHPNGTIRCRAQIDHGRPYGTWTWTHSDGTLNEIEDRGAQPRTKPTQTTEERL